MKKVFAVLAVLSLVLFSGPVFADGGNYADAGAAGVAGSRYDANGYFLSGGSAHANVARPLDVDFSTRNVGVAISGQSVGSDATAFACIPKKPYQSTSAFGEAQQWSGAGVNPNYGTFAAGGQSSGASYSASDRGTFLSHSEGSADTIGGTVVGAVRFDTFRSSTAMAGAVTGSAGKAYAGCDDYDTNAWGSGSVEHGTYANKGASEAWTGGSASYSYSNDGGHNVSGAGMAGTFGVSNVTRSFCGVTATARSVSFSTPGPTNANGGTYVNTFSNPN